MVYALYVLGAINMGITFMAVTDAYGMTRKNISGWKIVAGVVFWPLTIIWTMVVSTAQTIWSR